MRIHIIMHESFEAPGAINSWINKNKLDVKYTRLYEGDKFPETTEGFDYLMVMGGPQSPATTTEESPHFDSAKEISFIEKAIKDDKFLLGICLGAQLIGEALGASFFNSPNREIGVYDLALTEDGKQDPIVGTWPETFPVGHWHGDMPGLTSEAKILAVSEGCPRQIVRYSSKVYGFQCHFEFTKDSIQGMIDNCGEELDDYKDLPFVETREELLSHDYQPINEKLFQFLDYMRMSFDKNK